MSLTSEDKAWIQSLFSAELSSKPNRDEIIKRLEELETRFDDKLERVETSLLTAFHKWASPADERFRSHSSALRALDLEIEATKDRVAQLEQRMRRPPQ